MYRNPRVLEDGEIGEENGEDEVVEEEEERDEKTASQRLRFSAGNITPLLRFVLILREAR